MLPCVTVCCFVDTERVTVLFRQQDKDRATQSKRRCVILWTQNVLLSCFVNKRQTLLHRVRDGVLFCGHRTCYCLVLSTRDGQCYLETMCCLWRQNVLLSCFVYKRQTVLHRDGVLFCGHSTCPLNGDYVLFCRHDTECATRR